LFIYIQNDALNPVEKVGNNW